MAYNKFGGQIPWETLNLGKLTYIDLSVNNLIGQLPEICNNSTERAFLCDPSKQDQFVGPLPLNLRSFKLFHNLLSGRIPSWLYFLPSLEVLDLGENQFIGEINEFRYSSLIYLDLGSNKLQGHLPRSIFQQVNLSQLDLSSNNLSGVLMLEQFSMLQNLRTLDLSFNSLSVVSINRTNYTLPSALQSLRLSSCNISEFPYSLRSVNLVDLDLSNNRIKGSLPQWIWSEKKDYSLMFLDVSHNFLTHVAQIPWKRQQYIDLRFNQLQGQVPMPPPSTIAFFISNNQLVGEISSSFCNLSWIEVLDLSNNSLSGKIPSCLGNSSSRLSVLDLRMNKFHGIIPAYFPKGNSLRTLNVNGNQLEGTLPQSLLNCEKLEVLDVGNNKMNGSFPFWLESFPELQVLVLRSNRFSGEINDASTRFPFQKLRIMDLSNNEFTGLLPTEYFGSFTAMMDADTNELKYMEDFIGLGYYHDSIEVVIKGFYVELVKIQTMFTTIDYSKNNFTGEIPKLLGNLNSLKGLNLSHNKLTGPIPTSLGNLSNLEWLDLSSNELHGTIPLQLADLNQLAFLNLSMNQLEGPIPTGKQFNTFGNDSYAGNLGLCGFPLSESCGNGEAPLDQGDDEEHGDGIVLDWKMVILGYASGVVIGVSIGYKLLFTRSFDYRSMRRFRCRRET